LDAGLKRERKKKGREEEGKVSSLVSFLFLPFFFFLVPTHQNSSPPVRASTETSCIESGTGPRICSSQAVESASVSLLDSMGSEERRFNEDGRRRSGGERRGSHGRRLGG